MKCARISDNYMKKNKRFILGVILARAGSKRLPNKNIRLLNGRPLISYTIKTALKTDKLDDVVVSTDSKKIAGIAEHCGARVPFLRPARYATDKASSFQALRHAVEAYEKLLKRKVDIVVCLQPTSPTTTAFDIGRCVDLVTVKDYDSAITIFKTNDRPEWCGLITKEKRFKKYFSEGASKKMSRKVWFMPSGGVYAAKRDIYLMKKTFYTGNCGYVIIPPSRRSDIDTLIDFKFAEYLLRRIKESRR